MALDRRINAFRPDLAAASLRGQVEAPRFVDGMAAQIGAGRAWLRAAPLGDAAQETELLRGETVTVYEERNGWAWVQAANDSYVGYLRSEALGHVRPPTHRVASLSAPALTAADVKSPMTVFLPMNARVRVERQEGDFALTDAGFIAATLLAPLDRVESDFVAVAERFLGAPYLWGGKTVAGLDCSGLIQTAMAATGKQIPRDTDMQENFFTQPVDALRRGDLVFWKGHMGVMLDEARLLHANAFHMMVAAELLAEALPRIEKVTGPVTSIKRSGQV
jgi:cell wall-associated NlpC family hydrolase